MSASSSSWKGSRSASSRDSTSAARVVGIAWGIVGLRVDGLGCCFHPSLSRARPTFVYPPPLSSVTRNPSAIPPGNRLGQTGHHLSGYPEVSCLGPDYKEKARPA